MARRYKKREETLTARNLSNALSDVNFRWEEIGTELNIRQAAINNIDRNKRGIVNMCMLSLIDHWLRTDVDASWEKLAQALERLNENDVAIKIREKYIPESMAGTGSGTVSGAVSGTVSGAGSSGYPSRTTSEGALIMNNQSNEEADIRHIHVLIGSNEDEDKVSSIVNLYSEERVRLDLVDEHGCTLVHQCAKQGDLEAMRVLVALGADVNIVDSHRFTAFNAASYNQKTEVAKFLKEVGGLDGNVLACMEQSPQTKRPRRSLDEEEERLRGLTVCGDGGGSGGELKVGGALGGFKKQ